MGNGASLSSSNGSDGELSELSKSSDTAAGSKGYIIQLRKELREKDELLQRKDTELQHRLRVGEEKDAEIMKLRKEIHELKCVVQQTSIRSKTSILSTIQEDGKGASNAGKGVRASLKEKRQAVSGESSSEAQEKSSKDLERYTKEFR